MSGMAFLVFERLTQRYSRCSPRGWGWMCYVDGWMVGCYRLVFDDAIFELSDLYPFSVGRYKGLNAIHSLAIKLTPGQAVSYQF